MWGTAVQVKRFNWMKRPTQWETAQAWREQHRAVTERFLENTAATSAAFLNAQNNLTAGLANLTAQAAIQRLQAQSSTRSQPVDLSA